ncbi:ubiquinol cytochrome-c reductase assembly protein Cbp3 [Lineolata rhizophorae]|uniref:Ubiquinol cytochrome-c reductase assembly protein Cbp3 n=1 Tax=Lineolata rhizophorae TaxID=578093 RepID=A0A6A6NXW6_9PEZI|nr:ubiquinol cytochrome-c reductase assembly protein Cbp3 [Lineolata rhizophorae]
MSSYAMYALTDKLAKECCAQAEYRIPGAEEKGAEIETGEGGMHVGVGEGWWYEQLHLPVNFNTWAQVTFLHQYLLLTRLRQLPPESSREWQQQLVNHIFHAAEDRMVQQHRIDSASVRNAYKRDLFYQWRGVIAAYDEGIIGSDAVLATALWRNLFGGREDVDAVSLATVVAYVRRWVAYLDGAGDEDVLGGNVGFGGEERDRQIVLPTSWALRFYEL